MSGYYDYVLAVIPLTLLLGTGVLLVGGVGETMAVVGASALSLAVIGHAMFVNAPGSGSADDASSATTGTGDGDSTPAPAAD